MIIKPGIQTFVALLQPTKLAKISTWKILGFMVASFPGLFPALQYWADINYR